MMSGDLPIWLHRLDAPRERIEHSLSAASAEVVDEDGYLVSFELTR